jgi:hypothetical protein
MGKILEALRQFFTEDKWPFIELEKETVFKTGYSGKNANWSCYAQAREEQQMFIFYSVCPINIPQEKRDAVAEYLSRANYGLMIGNFEIDFNDGEVRYKTSLDVEDSVLTQALIHNLVYANVFMMDRYTPGIMEVVYGNVFPLDAIKKIEE